MGVTFQKAVLANGLTVIAETDPAALSAAVGYFVRTGARDEPGELMGVSHFLEHMMFKGTAKRTAELLNQDFDRIGAKNNAYTSTEMTCFHATVLPDRLPEANEIIADMMRPALRDEDFTTEKGVILEEIAMYEDNPFWVLYERLLEERYPGHPLGHRVLGTADSITALSVEHMREYFRNRYSADNTVVAAAGNVDFDRFAGEVDTLCRGWERTCATRDTARPAPVGTRVELRDDRVQRGYALSIWEGPGVADDDRYAAAILSQVLGGSENSRLHWALIDPGIAEEAESSFEARDGAGEFLVFASCDPSRLDEVCAVVEREVRSVMDRVEERELDLVRARLETAATVGGERPAGRMQRLGRQWLLLGRYSTLEEELDRIRGVTPAQVRDLAARFPFDRVTSGLLAPIN